MSTFTATVKTEVAHAPLAEKRLKEITSNMQAALSRQQSLYRGGYTAVARGPLNVAINQAGVEANQIHIAVDSGNKQFQATRAERTG